MPGTLVMALLKYLKLKRRKTKNCLECLPDASGPLAIAMPSDSITAANSSVEKVFKQTEAKKPRGEYQVYTAKERAEIGKRAVVYGITSTIRYYRKNSPQRLPLPSSSVFDMKVKYQEELSKRKRKQEKDLDIAELPSKKKDHSLLLGELLDGRVQSYIKELHAKGAVVNTAIVMACAEGVVMHHDSNLLDINGEHITITNCKDWAKSLLFRMGFVKRRVSTSAKLLPEDFDEWKEQFLYDAKVLVNYEEIPDSLVINWDHTGIKYIPVSSCTMEREGTKELRF